LFFSKSKFCQQIKEYKKANLHPGSLFEIAIYFTCIFFRFNFILPEVAGF